MNQISFSLPRVAVASALLVGSLSVVPVAHAGVAFRFTGSIVESRGSTRIIDESFDRSDAGGQGSLRFDEFPPLSDESRHLLAVSSAGNGYLTASAHAGFVKTWVGGGSFNDSLTAFGFASVTFDDFVFSGPNPTRSTTMNLHLSGLIMAGALPQNNCNGNVQVSFYYNDSNVGGGLSGVSISGGNLTNSQTGPLVGFTGNNNITSQPFIVATNVPVKIGFAMQVSAGVSSNFNTTANTFVNSDFGSTLTFAIGRPVFDLPPGYTVNSVQAGIVNNIYTPPCPADFNHDNQVDDADFTVFVFAYNTLDCADPAMPLGCASDITYDGFVDDADFIAFVGAYNVLVCP